MFSLHLFQEPGHLDPSIRTGSSANYFFYNTLRGLYRIDPDKGLQPEGGECVWKSDLHLECEIKDQIWSDSQSVTADDYIRAFQHLVNPETGSPRAYLLDSVKQAKEILKSEKPIEELGVKKLDETRFEVFFAKPDPEFLYKLSSTALYPKHISHKKDKTNFKKFVTNGPYQIKSWDFGKELVLTPNPYYYLGHKARPLVKFYFLDDEMTAYRLYQQGKLTFLRRVPSKIVGKLKGRTDFFLTPMARFDYIGYGARLKNKPHLREAMSYAVDYPRLKRMLHSSGDLGCPSIPHKWINNVPCYNFDLKRAKAALEKVAPADRKKIYKMKVSQQGGADIKQQAEFFQNQWKKHLGLNIQISQVENKVFINELRKEPPDIFRKGIGLDRPTCLNALETFATDNRRNYIKLKMPNYQKIIASMKTEKDPDTYKALCENALKMLRDNHTVIPLGEMHFSLMASPEYAGWTLNSLNQLDLSQLHRVDPDQSRH